MSTADGAHVSSQPGMLARGASLLSARGALWFVILLCIVSFFADMTYEGGRSLTGQYLALLGSSATAVALAAGAGELLGYTLRFASGYVADRTGRYWPVTLVGYAINLFAIPALALTSQWPAAIGLMCAERIGKGIRKPSVDAMLSHATEEMGHGWGFGLHEAADQSGAFLGPVLLAGILALRAGGADELAGYHLSFALLAIPAALAFLAVLVARFLYPHPAELGSKTPTLAVSGFTRGYWLYVLAAGLIGAGYADFQLIAYHVKATALAPDPVIPLLYALAMGTTAICALPASWLYDRVGFPVLFGLSLVGAAFAPLAFLGSLPLVALGVLFWGIGLVAQESVMAAALADLIPAARRAYG